MEKEVTSCLVGLVSFIYTPVWEVMDISISSCRRSPVNSQCKQGVNVQA
jgi:hypothetical protein